MGKSKFCVVFRNRIWAVIKCYCCVEWGLYLLEKTLRTFACRLIVFLLNISEVRHLKVSSHRNIL